MSGEKPWTFLFPFLRLDQAHGPNGLSSVLTQGRAELGAEMLEYSATINIFKADS